MNLPYNVSTFQLFNRESSVEFLLKNVRHIIMFNLIIANLDVKCDLVQQQIAISKKREQENTIYM